MAALTGSSAVVTGANSGVGRSVTELLLAAGAAVTLVCRDRQRGERALAEVGAAHPGAAAALEIADLASLERTESAPIEQARDRELAAALWEQSAAWTGLA